MDYRDHNSTPHFNDGVPPLPVVVAAEETLVVPRWRRDDPGSDG